MDSGAVGVGRDSRTQTENKKNAFNRCINSDKFQAWLKIEISRRQVSTVDIEAKVDWMMMPWNIKTEVID